VRNSANPLHRLRTSASRRGLIGLLLLALAVVHFAGVLHRVAHANAGDAVGISVTARALDATPLPEHDEQACKIFDSLLGAGALASVPVVHAVPPVSVAPVHRFASHERVHADFFRARAPPASA